MNLFDMVKRSDLFLACEGDISCCTHRPTESHRSYLSVKIGPLSTIIIRRIYDVKEFSADGFDTGWQLFSDSPHGSTSCIDFEVSIKSSSPHCSTILYTNRSSNSETIFLRSQSSANPDDGDLVIRNKSSSSVLVAITPITPHKQFLINSCKGKGIELGPGINPHINPSEDVDVFYIEPKNSKEWVETYHAPRKENASMPERERYIFGDARDIAMLASRDLDFIYSNHVIEHLLNPIRVISDSLMCLKTNGIFTGSVPSCANTFDLRQTPSTLDDLIDLEERDYRKVPIECYQKWVLHTEPRTTVESLVERSYSVHVTFWSIELLEALFDLLVKRGLARDYKILHERNSKDIQFILRSADVPPPPKLVHGE